MLHVCCWPVLTFCATTETVEVPLGVGVGGGVLLLPQPRMKPAEARLSRTRGMRSEILSRMLRRRCRSRRIPAFPDKHQVTNVNKRVGQISQNPDRVTSEDKVNTHDNTAGNAPVPERDRNHAFTLSLGSDPLDKKPHREKSVSNEAQNHEVTPIETENPVFFPDPGDCDKCECVHSMACLTFRLCFHKQ